MKKKRNLLSQMTTEQIVQRAIKKFAQNNNAVGCSECKKHGGHGCRNCDPVLAKAGLSKRSMTARLGKTAEEIRKLDYCREGLRRMRRGETKKYKRRKEKEEGEEEEEAKKKKKKEKKTMMIQTTTASSSSTSTCCIVDAAMERANSSKALVAKVVAKEEEKSKIRGEGEEEETDTPIVVDEARENAAMALILIAMRG
ncbi:unnamed protein product [Bathycoccus prasinos]